MSQSRVSRLLKEAHDREIVRISVIPPAGLEPELEDAVRDRYGLLDVVVVHTQGITDRALLAAIGGVAGKYIEATLTGADVVGISSWSETLLEAVDAMTKSRTRSAQAVVQLLGGVGRPEVQFDATRLASRLSEVTGAEPYFLQAPGLVSSRAVRDALLEDAQVARTAGMWSALTVALVGIGSLDPSPLLLRSGNSVPAEEMDALRELGAVGDVVLKFVDPEGTHLSTDLDQRVVGIGAGAFKEIPRRVGVAGGPGKLEAIRAVLRGGWVNVLITDENTAHGLVDEIGGEAIDDGDQSDALVEVPRS
ncbi:sugar-binding transcriptional regulator [Georgenia alba]|uniref:Sugar-binding transcriptional regulator n=1 Tax=Georgenia alba TaxID=2233858 RepID=A0ABW2Q8C4_9MICO